MVKSGRRIKLLTHLTDRPGELRRFVSYIEEYKANIVYVYMSMLDVTCLLVRHR